MLQAVGQFDLAITISGAGQIRAQLARETEGAGGKVVDTMGYQVRLCDEGCASLRMLLDMIVLALTGRVDAMILVWGDGHSISGDFLKGIRTAQAVGIQIETLALDSAPEVLKRVTEFHDLRDTMLLHPVR